MTNILRAYLNLVTKAASACSKMNGNIENLPTVAKFHNFLYST